MKNKIFSEVYFKVGFSSQTWFIGMFCLLQMEAFSTDYHVGPTQNLKTISEVPWISLDPGDKVYIHWSTNPYKEKWVVNRKGTKDKPIEIIGVNGPNGQKPVIDGNGAKTVDGVDFWNEQRGVIKVGGSNKPEDGLPQFIVIENLEIKSARPPYEFINSGGQTDTYSKNAASIYVEKATNLTIKNCTLHDSGNGLFIGAFEGQTQNISIKQNYIYNNGNDGSIYEHNTYTAAINIVYEANRFGPLRDGAQGNNLKDRSAGLVVRYNWIEGGNRQLDLVDAEDSKELVNHPAYHTTFVYGNVLIEPEDQGNSQMVHYGGDSGTEEDYRKGKLYLYNNTVISTRSGNTTLIRLSTNDETAEVFNNIIYTTASGNRFAMVDESGTFNMYHNWLKTDWKACHGTLSGAVNNKGNNVDGTYPLFENFDNQVFNPVKNSPVLQKGLEIPEELLPAHQLTMQYKKHQNILSRAIKSKLDIGAFEPIADMAILKIDNRHDVSLIPNPVTDFLRVKTGVEKLFQTIVYDEIGNKIMTSKSSEINLSRLEAGIYFIKVEIQNGKVFTRKIIKH